MFTCTQKTLNNKSMPDKRQDKLKKIFNVNFQYHPDKNKSKQAQEHFVRIVEAYNVLGKPGSRASYDNTTVYESSYYGQNVPHE